MEAAGADLKGSPRSRPSAGWFRKLLLVAATSTSSHAFENHLPKDAFDDDHTSSIDRLRKRLDHLHYNSTKAVVMVSGPLERGFSGLSIPVWEAYCRRHGVDFFLQEEELSTDYGFEWSKPRLLVELLPRARWKYVLVVDANSLPANFGKSWDYVIKAHLRHKRHANDKTSDRLVFCPWDCDEEYDNAVEDGACHGPLLSGCVWTAANPKKEKSVQLARSWYLKRKDFAPDDQQALVQAFDKMRSRNYDEVYYRDVQKEMGRPGSSFLATFTYGGQAHGWNVRDQIHEFLLKHPELGAAVNSATGAGIKRREL